MMFYFVFSEKIIIIIYKDPDIQKIGAGMEHITCKQALDFLGTIFAVWLHMTLRAGLGDGEAL